MCVSESKYVASRKLGRKTGERVRCVIVDGVRDDKEGRRRLKQIWPLHLQCPQKPFGKM